MAVVKLSAQDKERLAQVQKYLYRNGISDLEGLREICPKCGGLMDGFRLEAEYLRCPNCKYEEKGANLTGVGTFALGVLVAIGIAALATHLLGRRQNAGQ